MRHAIISVSDKRNLSSFAKELVQCDYKIFATGNTYKHILSAGVDVYPVEEITHFPEMMEGRLKTLHPMIHGGILGKRDHPLHQKEADTHHIQWIDLVVVNLYPFKETLKKIDAKHDDIIEQIDIGGPAMIRSAAKNYAHVGVVVDPDDYESIIEELKVNQDLSFETKRKLSAKAFRLTAQYDAHIASYVTEEAFPEKLTLTYDLKDVLRYGENPHQNAALYQNDLSLGTSILHADIMHGKALSYNNIQDANAACLMLRSFKKPTAVVVKHMNPCAIASSDNIEQAFDKAYQADPISIFGGIVAVNDMIDLSLASKLHLIFLEVLIAKDYTKEAFELLSQKKNIRLLKLQITKDIDPYEMHSIEGGMLIQTQDQSLYDDYEVPTLNKPSEDDLKQLNFGYEVAKHVKSNAIVIVKDEVTIGIGAGQMNRIGAAKLALEQAGQKAHGAYLASDGFFPMKDTVELAIAYGIKAIIQPGGSLKDQLSIDVCNAYGIIMLMAKQRHFRH